MNKWILIFSILAGVSAQAGNLKIQTTPLSAYVVPVSRPSCVQLQDKKATGPSEVLANSFEIGTLALQWKGKNPMQLGFITLNFKSPALKDGHYQCVIAEQEVETIFALFGGHIAEGPQSFYSGMCGVRCGFVNLLPEVKKAAIKGTMTVTGYELDEEGQFVPVTAEAPVTLNY